MQETEHKQKIEYLTTEKQCKQGTHKDSKETRHLQYKETRHKESLDSERQSTDYSNKKKAKKKHHVRHQNQDQKGLHKHQKSKNYQSKFFSGSYQKQYQKCQSNCSNEKIYDNIQVSFKGTLLQFSKQRQFKKFHLTDWLEEDDKFAASTFKQNPDPKTIPVPMI